MSLGPAKVRVEIFPSPGLFDDSFAKGWTKTSVGTSSVSTDGDVVTLNSGDQLQCRLDKDIGPLALATYTRLICRVISVPSGEAQIDLFVDGNWVTVLEQTSPGVYDILISGAGTSVTKIRLISESLGGAVASFDYVAICKNSLLVPDVGDLVEELRITRPLVNSGIAGAKLSIPNFSGVPPSWLTGWDVRRCHDIDAAAGAGTDYQVKIIVHYGAGVSSGGDVYCNSKCKTDFGDIRFTGSDGQTELDYWMMSKTNSDNAVFWVEVKDSLDSNVTIYLYYGNVTATTTSNFDATFIFGDPFDNVTLDVTRWTSVDGDPVYWIDATNHYLGIHQMGTFWWLNKGFHSRLIVFPTSYIIENAYSSNGQTITFEAEWAYDYYGGALTIRDSSSMVTCGGFTESWSYNYYVLFADVGATHWASEKKHNPYGTYKTMLVKIWKLGNMHVEIDGILRVDDVSNFIPDRVTLEIAKLVIETSIFGEIWFHAFKIRKYVSPEPAHNSWCEEETQ